MIDQILERLHDLTHKHLTFIQTQVGEVLLCYPRGPMIFGIRRRIWWFRPTFDGADWHQVPDEDVLLAIVDQSTPEAAMAVLRRA